MTCKTINLHCVISLGHSKYFQMNPVTNNVSFFLTKNYFINELSNITDL